MTHNNIKNLSSKADDSKGKVTHSAREKEINELNQHAEIRSERIKAIKKVIDSGDYDIDSRKLAMKVLDDI
jgi:flagellar biosynthesis anti-sigma factor FlgM